MKLLPSVFSSLYSRIKIFVFVVNDKRHFSILCDLFNDYKKRIENQRLSLPFAVNVMLNLSNISVTFQATLNLFL